MKKWWVFNLLSVIPILWFMLVLVLDGCLINEVDVSKVSHENQSKLKQYFFYEDSSNAKIIEYSTTFRFFDCFNMSSMKFEVTSEYYKKYCLPQKENLIWLSFNHESVHFLEDSNTVIIRSKNFPRTDEKFVDQKMIKEIELKGKRSLMFSSSAFVKWPGSPNKQTSAIPWLIISLVISVALSMIGIFKKIQKGVK